MEPGIKMIRERIGVTELLAGLAEEATELAQAALKLRRAYDKTNPTPMSEEECLDRLVEEYADVLLYIDVLYLTNSPVDDIKKEKIARWIKRLWLSGG